MQVSVRKWTKNKDSASVDDGPLTFSLDVGERWKQSGNVNGWPTWDVYPTTDWNYGLVIDLADPAKGFDVHRKGGEVAAQPWTPEAAPVSITAPAKRIPNWQKDRLEMVSTLQQSPVKSDEPTETVTLIPMGAARLRISQFPVIGTGADAKDWGAAPTVPYSPDGQPLLRRRHRGRVERRRPAGRRRVGRRDDPADDVLGPPRHRRVGAV